MNYIMGIDQGSSKTHVIIGDEKGNILGLGKSYGACHTYDGMQYAMAAVKEAMNQALVQAGLGIGSIRIVVAGMFV